MIDVEPGQVWEVYSEIQGRWTRVIVTKVENGRATLRYEGILEFFTVEIDDLEFKPDYLRPAADQN